MSVQEAGSLGGNATLQRHGRDHFIKAGRLGQLAMSRKYSSEDRRRWGKLGGRPRKKRFPNMGEEGIYHERRNVEPTTIHIPFSPYPI